MHGTSPLDRSVPAKCQICSVLLWLTALAVIAFVAVATGLASRQNQWSIDVDNGSDAPCTLVIAMESDGERTVRFDDIVTQTYHPRVLINEWGSAKVHSIKVISGVREKLHTLNEQLPAGTRLHIRIDSDLKVRTSVDYDYHM